MLRYSAQRFLVALVLMLATAPFLDQFKGGDLVEAVLMTLVLVSAVLAVGTRGRTLTLGIVLVTPALAGKWVSHYWPDMVPPEIFLVAALAFLVVVLAHLLLFTLRAPRVNSDVLSAGIACYLLLGLLWSLAYVLVARVVPDSFSLNGTPISDPPLHGFNAFYFSFITLSTVGYGDFVPVSNVARMLAATEAITGTLFVAVLIARLVALYSTRDPAPGAGGGPDVGQ